MTVEVKIYVEDEIVEKLYKDHLAQVETYTDPMKKAMMSIWSKEEILAAHAQTLLHFDFEGRLQLKDKDGE